MLSPAPCAQYMSNPHLLQVNGSWSPPTAAQASGCRECDAGAHPRWGRPHHQLLSLEENNSVRGAHSGTLDYRV
jgi:hypothetical protein